MLIDASPPEWVKASITTALGFASAYLLEMLKNSRAERRKREKMRKALYVELTQHYHSIRMLLDSVGKCFSQLEESAFDAKAVLTILGRSDRIKEVEAIGKGMGPIPADARLRATLAQLFRLVSMDSYKYAKSNPDVFYDLPEAFSIDACYSHLQKMVSEIELADPSDTLKDAKSFLDSIDNAVKSGALSDRMFEIVAPPLYAKMGRHQ